jgi:16S rRNA (guanine966-N2)-methyltransferase
MVKRSNLRRSPRGSVRIIGGEWRSRRIAIPEGTSVRPTPDRVRETLFNWLRDSIVGARCLDLYAGTGALGFEALSRGAAQAYFIERDPALIAALTAQAAAFGVTPRIVRQDAESFLRGVVAEPFDIVFVDPPYDAPLRPVLDALPKWLKSGGLIYAERPRGEGLPDTDQGTWLRRAHAGAVEYGLLQLHDPASKLQCARIVTRAAQ